MADEATIPIQELERYDGTVYEIQLIAKLKGLQPKTEEAVPELKPISEITKKDADTIAGEIGFEYVPKEFKSVQEFMVDLFTNGVCEHKIHPKNILNAYQYLQSKGYDIGSPLPTDKQEPKNEGWV